MATAKITMPDGISVEVNGTPEEVISVVENLKTTQQSKPPVQAGAAKKRGEIPALVEMLKMEDFFRSPRGLGDVQKKLAELGHHYPLTTLSGSMQDQVKRRSLRRFKETGKYVYVQ
jgi:hypothetical protein